MRDWGPAAVNCTTAQNACLGAEHMQINHVANYDAIVVGAGQAGLAANYHLKQRGLKHILLDHGRPGEVWRTQRWDSFVLNTPNLVNSLPGKPFYPANPLAFESPSALVSYFDEYVAEMQLPFRGDTRMLAAQPTVAAVSEFVGNTAQRIR